MPISIPKISALAMPTHSVIGTNWIYIASAAESPVCCDCYATDGHTLIRARMELLEDDARPNVVCRVAASDWAALEAADRRRGSGLSELRASDQDGAWTLTAGHVRVKTEPAPPGTYAALVKVSAYAGQEEPAPDRRVLEIPALERLLKLAEAHKATSLTLHLRPRRSSDKPMAIELVSGTTPAKDVALVMAFASSDAEAKA